MLLILPLFLVFLLIVMVPGMVAMVIYGSLEKRGRWTAIHSESGNNT